ncbi:MAG: hypothetical protein AAF438_00095 [Pseudomonadota bacterium]
MKQITVLLLCCLCLVVALPAHPNQDWESDPLFVLAEQCYTESMRTGSSHELKVDACNKALEIWYLAPSDRSLVLHNRGVIQLANGDLQGARGSFDESVELAEAIGMQNLALAQLAHKQGDYVVALEQYDILLSAQTQDPIVLENRDLIARNKERAAQALAQYKEHDGASGRQSRIAQQ